MTTTPSAYVFTDNEQAGATHHAELTDVLAAMLDPFTTRRLDDQAGVRDGWRCLEVGAGNGSVAGWLADRVGERGEVVATDKNPEQVHIRQDGGAAVRVIGHNVATDPLDDLGTFDLIHARLVLGHLPNRRDVLRRLAGALKPGGVLAIDEFMASWDRCLMRSPDRYAAPTVRHPEDGRLVSVTEELFWRYHDSLTRVLQKAGVDTTWGRSVFGAMEEAGLDNVDAEIWGRAWRGGQPGAMLPYLASAQLRQKLIEDGMSEEDLDRLWELLNHPQLVIYSNLAISTIGRAPSGAAVR